MKKNIIPKTYIWYINLWDNKSWIEFPEYKYIIGLTIETAAVEMARTHIRDLKKDFKNTPFPPTKDICAEIKTTMIGEDLVVIWRDDKETASPLVAYKYEKVT